MYPLSSLLNIILNEERAIVTDIEGTTRDTIEEFIQIEGIPLKIIDTAGIRNAQDEVEKIGVNKAIEIAKNSDIVIAIFDVSRDFNEEDEKIIDLLKDAFLTIGYNVEMQVLNAADYGIPQRRKRVIRKVNS